MADKVLVVDDDRKIRELLYNFLTLKGYKVITASSGEEALEIAKSETPQAILMDIRMSGIDGMETCRTLRAEEEIRHVPVILITAYGAVREETEDAGADDLVEKPFDMLDLALRLKAVIRIGHITDPFDRSTAYLDELQKSRTELRLR